MIPVEYDSIEKYVESAPSLDARITRVENIIAALEIQAATSGTTAGKFEEYSLDDGQTKIKTRYRNPTELQAALIGWDNLLQRLYARRNNIVAGRVVRLVDHKNFN